MGEGAVGAGARQLGSWVVRGQGVGKKGGKWRKWMIGKMHVDWKVGSGVRE